MNDLLRGTWRTVKASVNADAAIFFLTIMMMVALIVMPVLGAS